MSFEWTRLFGETSIETVQHELVNEAPTDVVDFLFLSSIQRNDLLHPQVALKPKYREPEKCAISACHMPAKGEASVLVRMHLIMISFRLRSAVRVRCEIISILMKSGIPVAETKHSHFDETTETPSNTYESIRP
jgi:hypothetical protein